MKTRNWFLILLMFGLGIVIISFQAGTQWGRGASISSAIYAVLVTLFLAAQVYGFIVTQVHYSKSIEDIKHQVNEIEEGEL